ncbi:MAG: CerR family C-terminal domain-containing protein [Planctomycetota bacterium]
MTKSTNSHSRPDQTRDRLIQAGLEIFAEHGFNAATTRMLSSPAGVNLAAIPYHFGGKEGLYQAVVRHIAQVALSRLEKADVHIEQLLQNDHAVDMELLEALEGLYLALARFLVGSGEADLFGPIIIREQMRPTAAFAILYESMIESQARYAAQLIGRLLHKDADDPEIILRTHALFGQVLAFRAARATVLRRMGWQTISEDQVEQICQAISRNVRAVLTL